ncbi:MULTISPECIES: cation transporter [Sphingobium]|jgi:Co/Zn/Cd efflux system component|uniref:Co/Zn/Cd efflux system component n=1 Tax=Sphingobium scionense TaxID=1404341 RepID=A0A7W6LVK7_9SPHN|nr:MULTISPECIES: cation transporter [Sphingobium]MBB4151263.1 Co/Zn/Cd efflux system component [Sphingobium scionense]
MACNSCASAKPDPSNDPRWRRAVWIALIINATMFGVEIFAGVTAHSAALKADALDFLGDSANYAISLGVAGMVLTWRARAAMLKGATLFALGVWVIGSTGYAAFAGTLPQAETMRIVGGLALAANVAVAFILYRFRSGEANMRSVWICSRNDAIGNVAVVAAAFGVFGTGSAWPDLTVAAILATLGISGGIQIMRQAAAELRAPHLLHAAPAQPILQGE